MSLVPTPPLPMIVRSLTAANRPRLAPDLREVTHRVTVGLPAAIPLDPGLDAVLVAAGGLARHWMRSDASVPVSTAGAVGPGGATPLRLLLRENGRLVAALPLARGPVQDVGQTTRLAVQIRDWQIHAGSLRGPGDHGSYLCFAWARLGAGADRFESPSARRTVRARLSMTPAAPLPDDPALRRAASAPDGAAPGPGSGSWRGYGWRDLDD